MTVFWTQVFLMAWDGTSVLIGSMPSRPSYKELETLVAEVNAVHTYLSSNCSVVHGPRFHL